MILFQNWITIMSEKKLKLINDFLDQIILHSMEQDKKSSDYYLFGVNIASSWMTFHLKSLKNLINSEE